MRAAGNRNFGSSKLNSKVTKYVSYFDSDDIPHPYRIYILQTLFNKYFRKVDWIFHKFSFHRSAAYFLAQSHFPSLFMSSLVF